MKLTNLKQLRQALTKAAAQFAPKANPVFTGSISFGRKAGTDIGENSTAVGTGLTASGMNSIAEGEQTEAIGLNSHAEGYQTVVTSNNSHAEGAFSKSTANQAHAEGHSTVAGARQAHAEGHSTAAEGENSHAEGDVTNAKGEDSHAEGKWTIALAARTHAEGISSQANGLNSHAEGYSTIADGNNSHAEGRTSKAKGANSHAEGSATTAEGDHAHSEGLSTIASGPYSHAEGYKSRALANHTHAGGYRTTANKNAETAIGLFNKPSEDNDLFVIGGGDFGTSEENDIQANCFRVMRTGVFATGNYNASGADYAEMFEWSDGNPNGEDRVGRFVALEGERIRLAVSENDFVIGIVSGKPSVVGDVYDDQWQGMYLSDVFGRPLYEDVEIPERVDEDGNVILPLHTEHRRKLNPEYNNNQPYIPRSKRPEWACVGMLGKLVVVDDGSCEVNSYCKPGENGIATKAPQKTRYRVMERLDGNHIRVLVL